MRLELTVRGEASWIAGELRLLQIPDGLLNSEGTVTVVGVLLVAVLALYWGLVTPKSAVTELKTRLSEREAEAKTLHVDNMAQREEKAELRGRVQALEHQIDLTRDELLETRKEVEMLRRGRTS